MDILRTLQSILSPGVTPANRARPAVPVGESQTGHRTFAQTLEEAGLEDPSIAPFGVRAPNSGTRAPNPPLAWPGGSEPATAPHGGSGGALINRDDHQEPKAHFPVDTLHVEIGDLGNQRRSVVTSQTEALTRPEPLLPPPNDDTAPVVPARPPAGNPPKAASPPRMPVPWPGQLLQPSGATGPGIQTTQGAVDQSLGIKFGQYTDPKAHGVAEIGTEGRLFLDAVKNGYVPNTAEGLGTMLAYLSMGDVRSDGSLTGRPAGISQYFVGWFSSANATTV